MLFAFLLSAVVFTWSPADLPPLNEGIIAYVDSVMGRKVDRGECWDLANRALKQVGASWDGKYKYGEEIDPLEDTVYPGDLIQFFNVRFEKTTTETIKSGNQTRTVTSSSSQVMDLHTAIVYEVVGDGVFKIAHQNTSETGKRVGIGEINLAEKKKGRIHFYRPTK